MYYMNYKGRFTAISKGLPLSEPRRIFLGKVVDRGAETLETFHHIFVPNEKYGHSQRITLGTSICTQSK